MSHVHTPRISKNRVYISTHFKKHPHTLNYIYIVIALYDNFSVLWQVQLNSRLRLSNKKNAVGFIYGVLVQPKEDVAAEFLVNSLHAA